jgi:hypothetical protein
MHRFVWEKANGPIPDGGVIDHINGVRWDNRLSNLRMTTTTGNMLNKRVGNLSGMPQGVQFRPDIPAKPYVAKIQIGRRQKHLGCFATKVEASMAYESARALAIDAEERTHAPR